MNRIVRDSLTIYKKLVIKGNIFIATHERDLETIDNLMSYTPISGEYDNLTIEGNLVVCEYDKNCDVTINGMILSDWDLPSAF